MPENPKASLERPVGEFKARLNREIAFTIFEEQIASGVAQEALTGRGLAKQYSFGSPQTWVTHLKDWREEKGYVPPKEAEQVKDTEEEITPEGPTRHNAGQDAPGQQVVLRSMFDQVRSEMELRFSEREHTYEEKVKVARMEGEKMGRELGQSEERQKLQDLEKVFQERIRSERLVGEHEGERRVRDEERRARVAIEQRHQRVRIMLIALVVGLLVAAVTAGAMAFLMRSAPPLASAVLATTPGQPIGQPHPAVLGTAPGNPVPGGAAAADQTTSQPQSGRPPGEAAVPLVNGSATSAAVSPPALAP